VEPNYYQKVFKIRKFLGHVGVIRAAKKNIIENAFYLNQEDAVAVKIYFMLWQGEFVYLVLMPYLCQIVSNAALSLDIEKQQTPKKYI
jgi:hypothetical protein